MKDTQHYDGLTAEDLETLEAYAHEGAADE